MSDLGVNFLLFNGEKCLKVAKSGKENGSSPPEDIMSLGVSSLDQKSLRR
jgi:hypothetical protein